MRPPIATQRTPYGEEAEAAGRAIFGLTAAVGAVATAMIAATGELPLIGLPTLVLLGCLVIGAPVGGAAYAGAAVWLVLAPTAQGEGLLAPLAMVSICLVIAIGPDRLRSWLERDAAPGGLERVVGDGWIEEVGLQ